MTQLGNDVRAVVFDFDYTLGDSSEGAVDCMRYALAKLGLPDVDHDTAVRTIGLSLPDTLVALAGEAQAHHAPVFVRYFAERADEIMVPRTIVYPDTAPTLAKLRAAGYRLAIVSNKHRFRIEAILARHDLADAVDAIVGSEDVAQPKPAPDSLLLALERLQVAAEETLYVGDSLTDARTAQAARVPFIAVTSGPTAAKDFRPWAPVAVLEGVADVVPWLATCQP